MELTFAEKLVLVRKKLGIYQYEIAERLGVHPNSIWKYERGEGKPQGAVVRMLDLLCEQENIRLDEYENARSQRAPLMKIVLAEKVSAATLAVFQAEPGWKVVTHDKFEGSLEKELEDADALIVRSAVQVTDELLGHAPKLRVIGRAGVGVDNIDTEAATRRGIAVMNTPGANAVAVAELTLGLMIALGRSIPAANSFLHAGKWEKKSLQGFELRGKTVGILGLGRIGLEVARRARAFDMEIIGHDPFVSAAVARENGVRLLTSDELFAQSDYLSLHMGLTPKTEGIVNQRTLVTMKPSAYIINCARGELIDEAALATALHEKKIAGAALDVFHQEPLKESPFFGMSNVILTPHIAGSTVEAQEAVGIQIAEQVKSYLKLGVVQNAVNLPSLTREEYTTLSPYVDLANRLGAFLSQASLQTIEGIDLRYSGALATAKTDLLRNAAIAGLLLQEEQVNRVNALSVAQERGIRIHEEKNEFGGRGGNANILTITLHGPSGAIHASGAVLHGSQPRLLEFGGIDVEAPLEGMLLVYQNRDVPGVVGQVGTTLGESGINIANFALGRPVASEKGEARALGVVQVDSLVKQDVIDSLLKMDALLDARLVILD